MHSAQVLLIRPLIPMMCSALVTIGLCWLAAGNQAAGEAARGASISLTSMIFSLVFLFRYGTEVLAIIAVTAVRVLLTVSLTGIVAFKFPTLRTPSLFFAVLVVYFVGLLVETRLVITLLSWSSQSEREQRS